ncbi:MAG: glycosyltransferase family 2 protein [Chitinophagaceae bacterium]
MIDVSVVIVNYNTFELTSRCIASVMENTKEVRFELIVVDNASTECDPALFNKRWENIRVIKSDRNLGFAGGNNLGIRQSNGRFILLLNSDTWLTENSIKITVEKMGQLRKPGFVGIRTVYPDQSLQYTCLFLPTLKNLLLRISFMTRVLQRTRPYSLLSEDFSPEAIWGSYMFFDRELLSHFKDQKLDESFFMYHEDLLWCWQARKAGFKNYFIATTTFVHIFKGSQSDSDTRKRMNQQFDKNFELLEKRINGWTYPLYRILKKIIGWKGQRKS